MRRPFYKGFLKDEGIKDDPQRDFNDADDDSGKGESLIAAAEQLICSRVAHDGADEPRKGKEERENEADKPDCVGRRGLGRVVLRLLILLLRVLRLHGLLTLCGLCGLIEIMIGHGLVYERAAGRAVGGGVIKLMSAVLAKHRETSSGVYFSSIVTLRAVIVKQIEQNARPQRNLL